MILEPVLGSDDSHMTPDDASYLVAGVKPWKLQVDWTVHRAYPGEPDAQVQVYLHVLSGSRDQERILRGFDTPAEAVAWAVKYINDRGHAAIMRQTWQQAWDQDERCLYVHAGPRLAPLHVTEP